MSQMETCGGQTARRWIYLIVLGLAGAWIIFPELGASDLKNDEAIYAQIVDHIRASGNWLELDLYGQPYFNKPPLYFWLTVPLSHWIPQDETSIRVASALFAWWSVLLTCWLGGRLFRAETGLLTGALLLVNHDFLLDHGAREGALDTGLIFFTLVALTACSLARRQWVRWSIIGLAVGGASLLKPLVGLPILALLGSYCLITERECSWRQRLGWPIWALVVALLLAGPWYLLQVCLHGQAYLDQALGNEIVKRATTGLFASHVRGPLYYPLALVESSKILALALPALIGCLVTGWRRPSWQAGLVGWFALGWLALCTVSSSKVLRYVYPVYPLFYLAIACSLEAGFHAIWQKVIARRPGLTWNPVPALALAVSLVIVARGIHAGEKLQTSPTFYLPWQTYCRVLPAIEQQKLSFVVHRLHMSTHTEGYYGRQMTHAVQVDTPEELAEVLRNGPAVVLVNDPALVQIPDIASIVVNCQEGKCIGLRFPCFLVWTWPASQIPSPVSHLGMTPLSWQ